MANRGVHAACLRVQRRARATTEGTGRGEQRTQNIPFMFVTLDVTQLSGWLNFLAPCQGSQALGIRCEASCLPGRREAVSVHRGGQLSQLQIGEQIGGCTGGAQGRAHCEHARHVRDAGRLEVKRLIEVRRVLPRIASRAHTVRGCGFCGVLWLLMSQCVSVNTVERARLQSDCRLGGRAQRGAHAKHVAHVLDAGRVEFDLLVEGRRALCQKGRMQCAGYARDGLCVCWSGGRGCGVRAQWTGRDCILWRATIKARGESAR